MDEGKGARAADASAVMLAASSRAGEQDRPGTEAAPAATPAADSPPLPGVIPSPMVHSPPPGKRVSLIPTGPEREDSMDSIGAEEEENVGGEEEEGTGGPPFRPVQAVARPANKGRRRARTESGDSATSGSTGASSKDKGSNDRSSPVVPSMQLPATPVGGGVSAASQAPLTIVLVGGFLLPPTDEFHRLYWGEALAAFPKHRILCVHPGPIASLHDRVCQIFYELKGGRVNYGKGHAARFGHDHEDEEEHAGLYPEWDADNPVHLIGHSFGGLTIRLLLHYLEKQAFPGHDTSPDWVRSVTTINAPHNGTHLVYGLGADPSHPPVVHWGSPGHLLGTLAHVVEFLDLPSLRRVGIDFGLGYFGLSRRHGLLPGLARVVKAVLGLSNVCTTPDNAAYDMTVHAALRINKVTTTYPGLFYFSFVGTCARHGSSAPPSQGQQGDGERPLSSSPFTPDAEQPQSQWLTALVKSLAYRLMAWHVSGVKFEGEKGKGEGVFAMLGPEANEAARRWADDGASDGVVSVFSQAFPRVPHEEPHHPAGLPEDYQDLVSGRWYVTELPVDHMGVVGYPHSHTWQRNFFQALYALLEHCHGRIWEGAMTPCTPHSSLGSPVPSPSTPLGAGAKDFTWAALSTPKPKPKRTEEKAEEDAAAVPLHRQPTLSHQPSRREIRRLERRGSWVLARQQSMCQCAGRKRAQQGGEKEGKEAAAASPSTRMLLCEECNKGLLLHAHAPEASPEHGQQHQEQQHQRHEQPSVLLAAGGLGTLAAILLLAFPLPDALALAAWVGTWWMVQHAVVPALLPPPSSSSTDNTTKANLWARGVLGVVHAVMASLASVALLLAADGGSWRQQLQLASCGYYALALSLALAAKRRSKKQQHLHVSRLWQGLLLLLHLALLLPYLAAHPQLQRCLSALLGLAELPNGLVLLRDLLVLSGRIDSAHKSPRPATGARPHHRPQQTASNMAGTRLAAAVWASIWAAFFLCQLFPLAYLFMLALASRALLLDLLPSTVMAAATVGVLLGTAAVGVLGRMKALSERFQLDFSKKHVQQVREQQHHHQH